MASNTQKRNTTNNDDGFSEKRENWRGNSAWKTRDFNKSMLVESPVEASANKNKESPREFLVMKVDAYLPGLSSVAISVEESEALIQEYFLKVRSTTTTLVSLNVTVKGKMDTNSHLSQEDKRSLSVRTH